ncbi:MAG TPA: hypothetical protein VK421_18810 [Pyrinomonadaceae bacterium]|nr:hypothetical protein [Pyrinomonadaceae bacterium]
MIERAVRVLFHLNGYTKVIFEQTEGAGMADGGITCDIPTEAIPAGLRKVGSRFTVSVATTPEEARGGYRVQPLCEAES